MVGNRLGDQAPWGWALGGALAGLLAALVAFAPARWAAEAIHAATDGRVQLIDPRGSIWTGSAQLTLTGGAGSRDTQTLPSRVAWQLRPQLQAHARESCHHRATGGQPPSRPSAPPDCSSGSTPDHRGPRIPVRRHQCER
jgi:hypothetical protein